MGTRAIIAFNRHGLLFRVSYAVFQNFIICLLRPAASTPYTSQWRLEGVIDETFFIRHWSFSFRLRGENFFLFPASKGMIPGSQMAFVELRVRLLGIKKGPAAAHFLCELQGSVGNQVIFSFQMSNSQFDFFQKSLANNFIFLSPRRQSLHFESVIDKFKRLSEMLM